MRFRFLFFPLLLILIFSWAPVSSQAQNWAGIIDAKRAIDWTQIGAGAIPTTRTQCVTAACNTVTANGAASTSAQIQTAINTAPANTFVLLPAGNYGSIVLTITNSNVTLRGSGPQSTILHPISSPTCGESHPATICIAGGNDSTDGSDPENIATTVSGYAQGSTSLTMTQTTGGSQPVVGQLVEMNGQVDGTSTAANTFPEVFSCVLSSGSCSQASSGAPDGTPSNYAGPFQMFRVTSIKGSCSSSCTIGVTPPVHMPNWGMKPVRVWWQNQTAITGVGLENLQIASPNPTVGFRWAVNSWMQNVEIHNTSAGTAPHYVLINHSALITLRDSYWYGSGDSGNDEYGIDCYGCSSVLAENNIIEMMRMWFSNEMGEGNVASYNYYVGNYAAQGGSTGTGGNCSGGSCVVGEEGGMENHGCCNGFPLLEGNDFLSAQFDNYFGNLQFATLFRNRFYGATILDTIGNTGNTSPINFGPLSRFSNVVGNIYGSGQPGYTSYVWTSGSCSPSQFILLLGGTCPGQGVADSKAYTSAFLWGNWDSFHGSVQFNTAEVPSGANGGNYTNAVPADHNLPASFLYNSQPAWWGVTGQSAIPWPAIGPDITGGNYGCSGQSTNCTGGGFANKIPARVCFESLGGTFSNTAAIPFDAAACYTQTASNTPTAPTGLSAVVQ